MKKVKGAWDREDDRNGGATNELYAGRRDQESCKGCAKAEAEVERLKAELARRVDHGGVIRERAGHDRDRDVELRQAEAEVERRRESELRATEAWERTVASNIEITQRAEKAEAEVERLNEVLTTARRAGEIAENDQRQRAEKAEAEVERKRDELERVYEWKTSVCVKCSERMLDCLCLEAAERERDEARKADPIRTAQREQVEWVKHNFGERPSWQPLLGAVEELGELAHAHLKQEQGIRLHEDHEANAKDAVADVTIYLLDYCSSRGWDFVDLVVSTWAAVRKRDWKKNNETAHIDAAREGE